MKIPQYIASKQELIKKAFGTLLGVVGVYSIIESTIIDSSHLAGNLSVFPALIILGYFYFSLPRTSPPRSRLVFRCIFATILSVILIIGGQLNLHNQIFWSLPTTLKIVCGAFAIYPVLELLYSLICKIAIPKSFIITRRRKVVTFIILLLACLVTWLIFLPGIYTYDMAAHNELLSTGILTPHWSILYGYILAGFLDFGHAIAGDYNFGFALFSLTQLIFISYVLYRIVIFATEITKNKYIYYISLIFFLIAPFVLVMSTTDAQDTVFGALMALLVIELYNGIFKKKYYRRKINICKLIIIAFLLTTIRNNGLFCLLFCLLFVLCFKIPNKKIIIFSLLAASALNFIYTGPVFNLLGVQKNTSATEEILSVPSQQLAKVYYENPTSLTEEDLVKLNDYYDLDGSSFSLYESYPLIADFTKSAMNEEYVAAHIGEYLGLWLKTGIHNPGKYIEAFLLNSFGFWYPVKNYDDERINLEFMNYPGFTMTGAFYDSKHENMKPVTRVFLDSPITKGYDSFIFQNGWSRIPVIAQINQIATYTSVLFYAVGVLILRKGHKYLVAIAPVVGLQLMLFLAPVAIYRYSFPVAILTPIFVSFIIVNSRKVSREQ